MADTTSHTILMLRVLFNATRRASSGFVNVHQVQSSIQRSASATTHQSLSKQARNKTKEKINFANEHFPDFSSISFSYLLFFFE